MINLRYHIISITAVFLALGMGLVLGSSFLDRVTVDNLASQLTEVERQVGETRTESEALRDRVGRLEERDQSLAEELPEQLFAGHLDGVPVLVIGTQGTDEALMDDAVGALASAGAQVAGTWMLTDRWSLDADDEVDELRGILGLAAGDGARLRRTAAVQLGDLLDAATQAPPAPEQGIDAPVPSEPELVARLVEAGFVDYEPTAGASDQRVLLPGFGARYLVISSTDPAPGAQAMAAGLLSDLTLERVAPVVAAQGLVDLPEVDGRPPSEEDRRTTFVGPLREGDRTRGRLSTVDDLDGASGFAAVVLALEDLATGVVGHFGVAPGASRLLPDPAAQP